MLVYNNLLSLYLIFSHIFKSPIIFENFYFAILRSIIHNIHGSLKMEGQSSRFPPFGSIGQAEYLDRHNLVGQLLAYHRTTSETHCSRNGQP